MTYASVERPAVGTDATTATKLVLELTHVVAAALVIPAITWRLSQRPGRSVG